ncbi:Phosphoglycolate phosphatase [bioreactor metagenome]|uniref:Phosphoglycolate phosphatase n=1 Tax=bioreactor metagenome TaxID=1076179 RepID=A0A645GKR9_9ZZZZ
MEDTPRHKPDPEPLFEFFARSGKKNDKALYIGDSANDQLCAKAAGVDFALAEWGATGGIEAKYILKAPTDIFELLKIPGGCK